MSMGTCNICGQYCNMLSDHKCHECRRAAHFNKPNEEVTFITKEISPVFVDRLSHWIEHTYAYHMGDQKISGILRELNTKIKDWELEK